MASGTLATVQSGNKRLLGKASPIYAVQVHDGLLYSGSTSADGGAVKVVCLPETKGNEINKQLLLFLLF